jgi:hypothetical protein
LAPYQNQELVVCTDRHTDEAIVFKETATMSTLCNDRIDTGDVLEISRDGEMISALVLLATDDAVILDACDDTTPFVVRRSDLVDYKLFSPELV